MVIDLGAAASGDWATVEQDVDAVRDAAPRPVVLKVILETALLDAKGIDAARGAAEATGADFVETSTGSIRRGCLRRGCAAHGERRGRPAGGVEASGGIRSRKQALAMVAAGARRLGVSATRAVFDGVVGPAKVAGPGNRE